jgi:4-hydroxy-tetrahydrodipicolinate reductase
MNILVLGKGKTGALVAEIARERGHGVRAVASADNAGGAAITAQALSNTDVVIDFTTPHTIISNIEACARAGTAMVVGTTGWYDQMDHVREVVKRYDVGFVFGANFSVGVNLFLDVMKAAAPALKLGFSGQMVERHHAEKKDKPSGTAVAINNILREGSGVAVEIESAREGSIVGEHELRLESENDVVLLAHSAKSRRGFAEGAVKAAEWIQNNRGFYDFKDVWRELR